jgi:Fic family protein
VNPTLFSPAAPGKLVEGRHEGEPYWAFVPAPLPPALELDSRLMNLLADASYALGELAALGRTLPNPHLLVGPFLRREAVLSSRIEGTQTTVGDLYAYEAGQFPMPGSEAAPPEADAQEVLNYVRALEYGLARQSDLPVSLRLIREIHARLMSGVRGETKSPGEFRRNQNWIGGATPALAAFVPPPASEMLPGLDAFERYLHAEDESNHALVRLALIHYQFEAIHPFQDGNGRIGRLLISLLMVSWALLPLPLLYLSAFFEGRRRDYYDHLFAVSARNAWRDWVLFFLQGVAEQSRDAGRRVRQLQDLQARWRAEFSRARSSALLLSLVDALFASPVLTIPQAQRLLDVSYPSAQRSISRLVDAGVLRQWGDASYGKSYAAEAVIRIVSAPES